MRIDHIIWYRKFVEKLWDKHVSKCMRLKRHYTITDG